VLRKICIGILYTKIWTGTLYFWQTLYFIVAGYWCRFSIAHVSLCRPTPSGPNVKIRGNRNIVDQRRQSRYGKFRNKMS